MGVEPQPAGGSLAEGLAATALVLLDQHRPGEALPLLERALLLAPATAPLRHARARALLALGRFSEAEATATAALALYPQLTALLLLRAEARLAQGAATAALDDAAAAVMAEPGSTAAQALMADALLGLGKFDEAIYLNGLLLRAEPDNVQLRLRLAQSFMRGERHAAAEELLRDIEAQSGSLPLATALRAQNKLVAGEAAEAERILRLRLNQGVQEAALHSVMAHALVVQGRVLEAVPHFGLAARLAPENSYLASMAMAVGPQPGAPC